MNFCLVFLKPKSKQALCALLYPSEKCLCLKIPWDAALQLGSGQVALGLKWCDLPYLLLLL